MILNLIAKLTGADKHERESEEWNAVKTRLRQTEPAPATLEAHEEDPVTPVEEPPAQVTTAPNTYAEIIHDMARNAIPYEAAKTEYRSLLHANDRQKLELSRLEFRTSQKRVIGSLQAEMMGRVTLM
jgi:hypothetical protein